MERRSAACRGGASHSRVQGGRRRLAVEAENLRRRLRLRNQYDSFSPVAAAGVCYSEPHRSAARRVERRNEFSVVAGRRAAAAAPGVAQRRLACGSRPALDSFGYAHGDAGIGRHPCVVARVQAVGSEWEAVDSFDDRRFNRTGDRRLDGGYRKYPFPCAAPRPPANRAFLQVAAARQYCAVGRRCLGVAARGLPRLLGQPAELHPEVAVVVWIVPRDHAALRRAATRELDLHQAAGQPASIVRLRPVAERRFAQKSGGRQ